MVYDVQMLLKPEWFVVCLNATEWFMVCLNATEA